MNLFRVEKYNYFTDINIFNRIIFFKYINKMLRGGEVFKIAKYLINWIQVLYIFVLRLFLKNKFF